jgi:hypothetical protein
MRWYRFPFALILAVLAACAATGASQPVERLDEDTGITVAALRRPIEFVEVGVLSLNKHASFAYLGPVEWDRMGAITYGLWLHVAPGNDRPVAEIGASGAVGLVLDDQTIVLQASSAPKLGHEPYAPEVPWGQTGFFGVTVPQLRELARGKDLKLRLRGADGTPVDFMATAPAAADFAAFVQSRGITGD